VLLGCLKLSCRVSLGKLALFISICVAAMIVDASEIPEAAEAAEVEAAVVSPADMAGYYDLIYQIRVVARKAGSKSSIGSGFQVSEDGLIVTNYHVVSMAVDSPVTHSIEYLDQAGNSGPLQLLDFGTSNPAFRNCCFSAL